MREKIRTLKFEKIYWYTLYGIMSFLMLRELLTTYVSPAVKFIPDLLIFMLLLLFVVHKKGKLVFDRVDIAAFIFLIFGAITTIYFNNLSVYRFLIQARSICKFYTLYFIFKNSSDFDKSSATKFTKLLIFMIYFSLSFALIEKLFVKEILFPVEWKNAIGSLSNFVRVYSILNNPNSYGAFLLMSLMILSNNISNFWVKKSIPVLSAIIIGIILTASRSTIILLGIFLIYELYAFIKNGLIKNKKILSDLKKPLSYNALIILFVLMIVSMLSTAYSSNFSNNDKLKKASANLLLNRFDEIDDDKILNDSLTGGR